jgi:hypothetical protein
MQQAATPQTAAQTLELVNEKLALEQQRCMVQGLQRSLAARQGSAVTSIETHISFVLVPTAPTARAAMQPDWTPWLKWLACCAFGKGVPGA